MSPQRLASTVRTSNSRGVNSSNSSPHDAFFVIRSMFNAPIWSTFRSKLPRGVEACRCERGVRRRRLGQSLRSRIPNELSSSISKSLFGGVSAWSGSHRLRSRVQARGLRPCHVRSKIKLGCASTRDRDWSTSIPFKSGSIQSKIRRSRAPWRACDNPSAPVLASQVSYPSCCSPLPSRIPNELSSSISGSLFGDVSVRSSLEKDSHGECHRQIVRDSIVICAPAVRSERRFEFLRIWPQVAKP